MSGAFGFLGSGAQAAEAADWHGHAASFHVVDSAYADPTERVYGIDSVPRELWNVPVAAAVGAPALRRHLVEAWPGSRHFTVVSTSAVISPTAVIGAGTLVAPLSVLSTGVVVGDHCLVNIGATLSHDCILGDFVTLSPGVHIAGRCRIDSGAFLGIGVNVLPGVRVGRGAVIGAGAVLTRDALDGFVYAGVPARIVSEHRGWPTTI